MIRAVTYSVVEQAYGRLMNNNIIHTSNPFLRPELVFVDVKSLGVHILYAA